MKRVAGSLKLELALYREVAIFSQFDADIDDSTKALLKKGQLLTEILKQPQNVPLPLYKQILILFAGLNGYLDNLSLSEVSHYEKQLFAFVDSNDNIPFMPYLETISELQSFDIGNNLLIDILEYFDYIYISPETLIN
jgi:F0F1-type ATP synthase alpha subunit